jgi:hypothetical protein
VLQRFAPQQLEPLEDDSKQISVALKERLQVRFDLRRVCEVEHLPKFARVNAEILEHLIV